MFLGQPWWVHAGLSILTVLGWWLSARHYRKKMKIHDE